MVRLLAVMVLFAGTAVSDLAGAEPAKQSTLAYGVTRQDEPLVMVYTTPDVFQIRSPKLKVLLVGGLDSNPASTAATQEMVTAAHADADRFFVAKALLAAIPVANPALTAPVDRNVGYPPSGEAYTAKTAVEAAYLWRWLGQFAPDLVVIVRPGDTLQWNIPPEPSAPLAKLAALLEPRTTLPADDRLAVQLQRQAPAGVGTFPALEVEVPPGGGKTALQVLAVALAKVNELVPSPARRELQARLDRSAETVARQLLQKYGKKLDEVQYIPALALVGRLEFGTLTGDASQLEMVQKITAKFHAGEKPALGPKSNNGNFAGCLVFAKLAELTKDEQYIALVRAAANHGFKPDGTPLPVMPTHNEMSDNVFMGSPILAAAGGLTQEAKYADLSVANWRYMQKLCLRPDGLYRHSPLNEAAWGRGNGFPALGLALALSYLPETHPDRQAMIDGLRDHLRALVKQQDPTGAWHQVVDHPESYREFTSTAMIVFAMQRGVLRGWLERAEFTPAIEKGWESLQTRIASDGKLIDVCTGTGKQRSLRDYLDRPAILGADERGGAMALMVSTERLRWEQDAEASRK